MNMTQDQKTQVTELRIRQMAIAAMVQELANEDDSIREEYNSLIVETGLNQYADALQEALNIAADGMQVAELREIILNLAKSIMLEQVALMRNLDKNKEKKHD